MADLRFSGDEFAHRLKVRNLSAGGLLAEGGPTVVRGANVSVELRNIGLVEGVVAWVQDGKFGVAFAKEIDPKLARTPVGKPDLSAPRFTRPSSIDPNFHREDGQGLRKI